MAVTSKATMTKLRIREIIRLMEAGEAVTPDAQIWTLADCLTVAGVLLSSAMSAGAFARAMPEENRESPQERLKEFQATIELVAAMATAERNGTWDDYFEPSVTVGIGVGRCAPLAGFKR
jgi:hypothetical protein